MEKEKITSKPKKYNLFLRTLVYSILVLFISVTCYFGNIPFLTNLLHDLENKSYDLLFIARHKLGLNPKPPEEIVIVGIDAASIKQVGIPWPWPRQFHASLVDGLKEKKAKLIVFDIIFDTISPLSLQTQDIKGEKTVARSTFNEGKIDDEIFANSLKKAKNVILACEAEPVSGNKYIQVVPIPTFLKALNNDPSFLGNTGVSYDSDNFVRKARIIYPELYPDKALSSSIALRAAQKYLNINAQVLKDNKVQLQDKFLPDTFLINFFGPSGTIKTISYWKALESIFDKDDEIFKGKIVLIGRTKLKASIDPYKSVRAPDTFPTPFSAITPNFAGVELQANILGNILKNNFIIQLNNFLVLLLYIGITIICIILISILRTKLVYCFYICLFFGFIYLIASFIALTLLRIYIPATYPIYGIILPIYFINFLDQYFFVDSARRKQAKIFRQLVPLQIADEIEKMDTDELALGGTKRIITVLFADIKNFTGICEKESPEIVVNILNKFFTEMVNAIHTHYGLVDKFIGDAIMAIWGSPKVLEPKEQATYAAKCALAMQSAIKSLNQLLKRSGFTETLAIRIGINTAEAVTGNVGSPERMQFSAIGDGVNVAARLEAVNKVYGTDILLSNITANLILGDFHVREIDTVLVPGRDQPVEIYELINDETYNKELINYYSLALKAYREMNFSDAVKYWEKCMEKSKNDLPTMVMLQRVKRIYALSKSSELIQDWKPIFVVENK